MEGGSARSDAGSLRRRAFRQIKQILLPLGLRVGTFQHYGPVPALLPPEPPEPLTAGPLVSIVTPSFNQAPFLEATIRSVVEQGYPNLEYIVRDGGSTDGTVEILQRYAGRLKHWASEPDRGQAHAINLGFPAPSPASPGGVITYDPTRKMEALVEEASWRVVEPEYFNLENPFTCRVYLVAEKN